MAHSNPAVILSVRIPPETRDQLEELSDATGRTKSFLAAEAIEGYLAVQAWQVKAIKVAVQKANSKEIIFPRITGHYYLQNHTAHSTSLGV